jgi:deazaflavin-dependent oxidoreductase (nitroreductase family)
METSPMNALFKIVSKIHVWIYQSSGGKRASSIGGKDVALLTTKGRKTGAERTVPLMCFPDGADRIVIGSKGGAPEDPAWFLNLKADPNVTVQLGPDVYRAKAVITEPEERARLWAKVKSEAPQFASYEKKTTRVIPIVRLVRATAPS